MTEIKLSLVTRTSRKDVKSSHKKLSYLKKFSRFSKLPWSFIICGRLRSQLNKIYRNMASPKAAPKRPASAVIQPLFTNEN